MNRNKLKNYAPQARRDFIAAVTERAALYGLTAKQIEPVTEQGDVAIIGGKAFSRAVGAKRKRLEERITRQGFEQVMETMAYTWFNRLVAIRFMELHGYLDHGYRVLSHPEGKTIPEIVEHAEHVDLPGVNKDRVIDLKLDGTKEAELYRLLLIAQCNALSTAMPFLFERIDDETELLLPDNLLHSDSLIRKLVNEIDEEDWQEVEIIGWLYQFYISEKKDQVIGKLVKSEDIPAATQLFTPNWIVKYLVQNTLGRQWLATYPDSSLREKMEYYIEPAEQTPEVQAQLKAITPDSLNPEELTLLDPACGSGHILVEAYELLKEIYLERGYRIRDIPTLILQKNLFGLEIDDRAAQLAAFALMMKARADDRRIFGREVQPNVLAIQESKGLNAKGLSEALNVPLVQGEKMGEKGSITTADVAALINLFEHGKTFGSLIQVPPTLAEKLPTIGEQVRDVLVHGDLMMKPAAKVLLPFVEQAWLLSRQYDAVVTNPPYMSSKSMNSIIREFAKKKYPQYKSDLFAIFIVRILHLAVSNSYIGMMSPFVWMFISSYEPLRKLILGEKNLSSLIQPEYHAFFDSAYVPICAFVIHNTDVKSQGDFINLSDFYGEDVQPVKALEAIHDYRCNWRYLASSEDFGKIPGSPIAYWISEKVREIFGKNQILSEVAEPKVGLQTGKNDQFLRFWHEVDLHTIGFGMTSREEAGKTTLKWFPHSKGGSFRRWYGNNEYVVNWQNDGEEIWKCGRKSSDQPRSYPRNVNCYFKSGITWSDLTVSFFAGRFVPQGHIFDIAGPTMFLKDTRNLLPLLGYINSKVFQSFLNVSLQTMHYSNGVIGQMPCNKDILGQARYELSECLVEFAKTDWDEMETSWDFACFPCFAENLRVADVEGSWKEWSECRWARIRKMKELEEENNGFFIEAYGLQDELSPEVPEDQITLARPDREEDIKRLLSYALGCMMGRYSLDKPGLIYAHSGNTGFDPSQYITFPADEDGVVPLMETEWFPDDATNRFVEFISIAWPKDHLAENLRFVADSLGPNRNEQPRETIRRYFATGFFKDHLKTYKRRPIYWLFSSGKQRAFQCLVYLHRYNEGTLSRMRTEYVIPLQGKIASRIEHLAGEIASATSTSHRRRQEKERDKLIKQQAELQTFDEKLRHYADQRISLDLDDGVKVNYGKFGDLLAEVKAVCGKE